MVSFPRLVPFPHEPFVGELTLNESYLDLKFVVLPENATN
jgi:hypothetical protein